ncbi:MAG: hypothetical protein IKF91_04255 [Bacilli bacterium]|nr:hypothetical protein [Bacilli bacterium]
MTEELYNKLSLYKNDIIYMNKRLHGKEEIKNQFEDNMNKIISILNNVQSEENKKNFLSIMKEIKVELRRDIIKACQEKQTMINKYGTQCYELLMLEDYEPITSRNYLIELCDSKIDEILHPEEYEEIDQSKKRIYIYSSRMPKSEDDYETIKLIREDLSSISDAYYKDIEEMVEEMHSGIYIGKEHKCKILKGKNFEKTIEHRKPNGTRIYENSIRTYNNVIARKIKQLESELGAEIHFVYKIEIKKCTQANGLDKEREERYKNEKANYVEVIPNLTAKQVQELADATYKAFTGFLEEEIKKQTEEEREKEKAVDIINSYLHTRKEDSKDIEFTGERALENERYQIIKRIIKYLDTKDLFELQRLSNIFDLISTNNILDNTHLSEEVKNILIEREKCTIILIVEYKLKEMTLEELQSSEIDILMLMDYEEEYFILNSIKKEESEYGI